jgi:hypothetical protein
VLQLTYLISKVNESKIGILPASKVALLKLRACLSRSNASEIVDSLLITSGRISIIDHFKTTFNNIYFLNKIFNSANLKFN